MPDPAVYYTLPIGVTRDDIEDGAHGTVGAVALDTTGGLAAATSTGGTFGKLHGRIGDTPLIGLDSEAFRGAKTRRETLESGGERRRFLEALEPNAKATASPGEAHLGLDELTRRILRSTRTFLRERLRLRLPRPERAIDDFDPVDIDALD